MCGSPSSRRDRFVLVHSPIAVSVRVRVSRSVLPGSFRPASGALLLLVCWPPEELVRSARRNAFELRWPLALLESRPLPPRNPDRPRPVDAHAHRTRLGGTAVTIPTWPKERRRCASPGQRHGRDSSRSDSRRMRASTIVAVGRDRNQRPTTTRGPIADVLLSATNAWCVPECAVVDRSRSAADAHAPRSRSRRSMSGSIAWATLSRPYRHRYGRDSRSLSPLRMNRKATSNRPTERAPRQIRVVGSSTTRT